MKKNRFYFIASLLLFLLPLIRIFIIKARGLWLIDFAAYSAVSRALFEGSNPFPDNCDALFCQFGGTVPIVYPGHMLLFALPGFIWGDVIQIVYLVLNVAIIYFLTGLTLIKACGYKWRDLFVPGAKQLGYALCCFCFFSSNNVMTMMRTGQIVLILALCLYCMFWGPASRCLRVLLFAFIAVTKYSVLTVFAPLLFFKRHWKLCLTAFAVFLLLSVSPILCGNNLKEVYFGYFKAVGILFQPGQVNHFDMSPQMCHLGFFKISIINHILKALVIGLVLWLFWRERKTGYFSDTLMMLALSCTMLISYHGLHDVSLLFPLFFIRLFDFARNRRWKLFCVTALFPLYLDIPGAVTLTVSSWLGKIPGVDAVVYLSNRPWGSNYMHVFPITPFFAVALALWSLYLYLHVKDPYLFKFFEESEGNVK